MKFVRWFLPLVLFFVFAVPSRAQSASAPAFTAKFNFTAKVLSLPGLSQTAVATDAGGTWGITKSFALREDSILVPSDNTDVWLGGGQYALDLASLLKKTNLPANEYQAYVVASLGVDRVTLPGQPLQQHIAAAAGFGINYDPLNMGHFSLNLAELRWARIPGVASNTVLFSSGVNISF